MAHYVANLSALRLIIQHFSAVRFPITTQTSYPPFVCREFSLGATMTSQDPVGEYIAHQAASAILFRTAHEKNLTLASQIEELVSELQVWKVGHREVKVALEKATKELKAAAEGDPLVSDACRAERLFAGA